MIDVQLLKKIPLFRDISEPVLKLVAEGAEERTYSAGETIVTEGQPAGALLIVRNGQARSFWGGDPTPIMLGPGDSVGEASLLDGGPVGVSVVAVERVDMVLLRPDHLKKVAENHEAAHHFFRAVAVRLASRLRTVATGYALAREATRKQ